MQGKDINLMINNMIHRVLASSLVNTKGYLILNLTQATKKPN